MHVLLLQLPKLLRGILEHAIRTEMGCEVLKGDAPPPGLQAGAQLPPDLVILGISDADDTVLLPALFARWPRTQVMTLMRADGDATLYRLQLDRRSLAAVSPDEILQVLRETLVRQSAPPAEERSDPCPPS